MNLINKSILVIFISVSLTFGQTYTPSQAREAEEKLNEVDPKVIESLKNPVMLTNAHLISGMPDYPSFHLAIEDYYGFFKQMEIDYTISAAYSEWPFIEENDRDRFKKGLYLGDIAQSFIQRYADAEDNEAILYVNTSHGNDFGTALTPGRRAYKSIFLFSYNSGFMRQMFRQITDDSNKLVYEHKKAVDYITAEYLKRPESKELKKKLKQDHRNLRKENKIKIKKLWEDYDAVMAEKRKIAKTDKKQSLALNDDLRRINDEIWKFEDEISDALNLYAEFDNVNYNPDLENYFYEFGKIVMNQKLDEKQADLLAMSAATKIFDIDPSGNNWEGLWREIKKVYEQGKGFKADLSLPEYQDEKKPSNVSLLTSSNTSIYSYGFSQIMNLNSEEIEVNSNRNKAEGAELFTRLQSSSKRSYYLISSCKSGGFHEVAFKMANFCGITSTNHKKLSSGTQLLTSFKNYIHEKVENQRKAPMKSIFNTFRKYLEDDNDNEKSGLLTSSAYLRSLFKVGPYNPNYKSIYEFVNSEKMDTSDRLPLADPIEIFVESDYTHTHKYREDEFDPRSPWITDINRSTGNYLLKEYEAKIDQVNPKIHEESKAINYDRTISGLSKLQQVYKEAIEKDQEKGVVEKFLPPKVPKAENITKLPLQGIFNHYKALYENSVSTFNSVNDTYIMKKLLNENDKILSTYWKRIVREKDDFNEAKWKGLIELFEREEEKIKQAIVNLMTIKQKYYKTFPQIFKVLKKAQKLNEHRERIRRMQLQDSGNRKERPIYQSSPEEIENFDILLELQKEQMDLKRKYEEDKVALTDLMEGAEKVLMDFLGEDAFYLEEYKYIQKFASEYIVDVKEDATEKIERIAQTRERWLDMVYCENMPFILPTY